MFRLTVCFVTLAFFCAATSAWVAPSAYRTPIAPYGAPMASYGSSPVIVQLPSSTQVKAAALTEAAGASAAAAKLKGINRYATDRWGKEIGTPILVKPAGALTNLYAAALPPRSFVGNVEPAFVKDSYGNIVHQTYTAMGAIAI